MTEQLKDIIIIRVFTFIILPALISCNDNRITQIEDSLSYQAKDNWKYKQLKGKFYLDEHGRLFERKMYAVKGKGEMVNSQIYFDSLLYLNSNDTVIERQLSEVIDIKTFTDFGGGSMYSKDRNNVYYSNVSSGGDFRIIVAGANSKTFRPLSDYLYGMDDKNIYYRGKAIEGLNYEKHKIIYSLDTADDFIDYIIDDKAVFYNGDSVKGADAKTFKLVVGQKWSAEDKSYKYECCGQRFE